MKRLAVVIATLVMVCYAGIAMAASKPIAKQTTLGVPSYPGWTIHRLDDQIEPASNAYLYRHQYSSNDSAQDIVRFYEERLNAAASFTESTLTHTIDGPDGAMVQITAQSDGALQTTDQADPAGATWKTVITILKFEAR